jgi:hypothetical protein
MTHIPLSVPSHQETQALRLGAVVDQGQWSLPPELDPYPFHRWLRGGEVNIRAREYWQAKTLFQCSSCQEQTPVLAFVLGPGHQILEKNVGSRTPVWTMQHHHVLVSRIHYLIPSVFDPCHEEFEWFQPRILTRLKTISYINLCMYCQTEIIDLEIFDEPGEGFLVTDIADSKRIELSYRSQSFLAEVDTWMIETDWLENAIRSIGS